MITIQKATHNDAMAIQKLLFKTWTEAYKNIFSPEEILIITSEWHRIDLLLRQINDAKIIFLVAKDDTELVGMCNTEEVISDYLNIQRLHVKPDYQRRGIGSRLMHEIIIANPLCKSIALEVEENNTNAINFYQKLGFVIQRRVTFEVHQVSIPCFKMGKELSPEKLI